jgi:transcriptional regulator with XRE-family HTH domain
MGEIGYHWWEVYGHFAPGVGSLPHAGEVYRHYRKLRGLTEEELATRLKWTVRYIKMLESKKNKNMPDLLSRRVLLAKVLNIPPILLGLSAITLVGDNTIQGINAIGEEQVVDTRAMAFYEGMLVLSWDFYYTSSVQRAAKQIQACFDLLDHDAQGTTGVQLDQYDAMRCRFYQLFSLVARDQMNTEQAIADSSQAVTIAERLGNAELLASSLLRRARISIQQQSYDLAYQDAQKALPYADLSRDPLKGKVYQIAGETLAYIAGNDVALQKKSLEYFNEAGRIARKGNLKPDGSFVKVDLTSIYIERAKALTLFRRYDDAHNALAVARKNLSPGLIRWEINLLIQEARTYYEQQQYNLCCISLLDALKLVRAVKLESKEDRISTLYQQCQEKDPRSPAVQKLGKVLFSGAIAS